MIIVDSYKYRKYLLDRFPATVAYSLRKIRTGQTRAIRVRRSSDNTEQDIGFVGNDLDTASLLSFCGAGNGFVTTWYDQSSNGYNVTQTTQANQPQIVNSSGTVITNNGKPTISFNRTSSRFLANTSASAIVGVTNSTLNMVSTWIATNAFESTPIVIGQGGERGKIRAFYRANYSLTQGYGTWFIDQPASSLTLDLGNTHIFSAVQSSQSLTLVKDGITASYTLTDNPTNVGTGIISLGTMYLAGVPSASYTSDINLAEVVIFSSAISVTDRQLLERNQGLYYSITVA